MTKFKVYDPHPEVMAAGAALHKDPMTANLCLDYGDRTPYSKRSLADAIQHVPSKLSPNVTAVSEKARQITHGLVNLNKMSAADVLTRRKTDTLFVELEERRERVYHRKEHQILGKPITTSVKLPEFTEDPEFKFGRILGRGTDIKDLIYPVDYVPSTKRPEYVELRSYGPGVQKKIYGPQWQTPKPKSAGNNYEIPHKGVDAALYWEEERNKELKSKVISKKLADFRERSQPILGQIHDPMKDTIAHIASDHAFGLEVTPDQFSVSDLIGDGALKNVHYGKARRAPFIPKGSEGKIVPAGIPTTLQYYRQQELEGRGHDIYPISESERMDELTRKVTDDFIGGVQLRDRLIQKDIKRVFGMPSVREPRPNHVKKIADNTNYGNELGAKALIYPTAGNIYGSAQLLELERQLEALKLYHAAAA